MEKQALQPIRFYFFAVLAAILFVYPTSGAWADKNASLMIDANSGKVLHAESASHKRYPASLTKLMTLYMTFDALRTGQVKLNTRLKASKKAAAMPSTNIRMKRGDRITVQDAIKALIVRSANDVAVVLAEHLGGSEYKFSKKMTAVARRLGMKNTTFKNASGLPNRQQVTTARDMAVLALALRRHYPQYYHYFRTQTFKYKGKKYTSHNKAMNRISGADGLKTGYIRASGFNLITSAIRRGKSVIGVVMGGESSKSRDDKMVRLVERTFTRMNLQNNRRQFVLNDDPVPLQKPQELVALAQKRQQLVAKEYAAAKPVKAPVKQAAVAKPVSSAATKTIAVHTQGKPPQFISVNLGNKTQAGAEKNTSQAATTEYSAYDLEMQMAKQKARGQFMPVSYQTSAADAQFQVKSSKDWGVQVGAYAESREALVAASNAASVAPKYLGEARVHVTDQQKVKGKTLYRARLANMTETQARNACNALENANTPCFVYREKNSNI